jgi:hypothetical protein
MTAHATRVSLLTAEDVAYAQFLMRVHELQEDPLVVGGIS